MKKISTLLLMLVSVYAANAQGKKLPDLKLKDLNGKEVNVQSLADSGKITIISLWATWCSPCIKEIENMNELLDDWKAKYNVQLIAVTVDNARNTPKVKPFVDAHQWDFPVLLDVNEDLKRALNAPSVPYLVLVDSKGNIVYEHNGYVPGDEFKLEEKLIAMTRK